jgi:hypothetical protein
MVLTGVFFKRRVREDFAESAKKIIFGIFSSYQAPACKAYSAKLRFALKLKIFEWND